MARRQLKNWQAPHKDSQGRSACRGRYLNRRGCRRTIGKARRTWCSQECIDYCMFQTHPGFARTQVFARDKGVCASCGIDTEKIGRIFSHANAAYNFNGGRGVWYYRRTWLWRGCNELLMMMGFKLNQSLWELDHIVELADGGGRTIDNCQTLCVPCHRNKTRRWYRRKKRDT